MNHSLTIDPTCEDWPHLISSQPNGTLFHQDLSAWREQTRRELRLCTTHSLLATGHQALLWHPGVLAKYLVASAAARKHGWATANLIVDQHVGDFGQFDVPTRSADGVLGVKTLDLCRPAPRPEVPMGRHEAFTPPKPPIDSQLRAALPSVYEGVQQVHAAVYEHRFATDAAKQMAAALQDLMSPWVSAMPAVSATDLMQTSLALALLKEMARDPWHCAQCYNSAIAEIGDAGVGDLQIRDDYVELPLWRIRDDGRRMRAYDNDVERAIESVEDAGKQPLNGAATLSGGFRMELMPRALMMTALARLGMADLFIHGKGGAIYDRAMELWIQKWLGVKVSPATMVSADVYLPLTESHEVPDVFAATRTLRRLRHDPESALGGGSAAVKRQMLQKINNLPRNSSERRSVFIAMHEQLDRLRGTIDRKLEQAEQELATAQRMAVEQHIARRRDWAFPLYPREVINSLAEQAMRLCG